MFLPKMLFAHTSYTTFQIQNEFWLNVAQKKSYVHTVNLKN